MQKQSEGFVLINSGITKSDGHENLGRETGEVFVMSTNPPTVKAGVEVGGLPVHSYGVYPRNQFWTYLDETGDFFVIDLDVFDQHKGKPISVKVSTVNHRKFLLSMVRNAVWCNLNLNNVKSRFVSLRSFSLLIPMMEY